MQRLTPRICYGWLYEHRKPTIVHTYTYVQHQQHRQQQQQQQQPEHLYTIEITQRLNYRQYSDTKTHIFIHSETHKHSYTKKDTNSYIHNDPK